VAAWSDAANDGSADFAARLTQAAYGVALRHGVGGSFADLELELWRELTAVVAANDAVADGDVADDLN
jgi:hypothetical protein